MAKYILTRIFHSILMILGITIIIFVVTNIFGDPVALLLDPEATTEQYEMLKTELGLDRPAAIQYFKFLNNALRGDFGKSFVFEESAMSLVLYHLPATIELALGSMFFAILVAIPVGVLSAVKPYSLLDRFAKSFALAGQAAPTFWLGIIGILLFGVKLQLLPVSGRGGILHLILPAMTLGTYSLAAIMRLTRSAMLDVLDMDYIRTARIKGLFERTVILKHAFKNALIPVITIVSLFLGRLLGGAVITETIFAWPGLGRLAIQSISANDFPVVQAAVFIMSVCFIFVNLVVDVIYCWIDPRISYD